MGLKIPKPMGSVDFTRTWFQSTKRHSLLDPEIIKDARTKLDASGEKYMEVLPGGSFLVARTGSPHLHRVEKDFFGTQCVFGVVCKPVYVMAPVGINSLSVRSDEAYLDNESVQMQGASDFTEWLEVALPPFIALYTRNYATKRSQWAADSKLFVGHKTGLLTCSDNSNNIPLVGGVINVPTKEDPYLGVQVYL